MEKNPVAFIRENTFVQNENDLNVVSVREEDFIDDENPKNKTT